MEVSGHVQESEYKEMFYQLLYACRHYKQVTKVLIDLTYLEGVKGASRAWLLESFSKRFNDEFGKHMWVAAVEPGADQNKSQFIAMTNALQNQKLNFRLQLFPSVNEAVQWLMLNS